jgi:hypothetical protein
MEKLAGRKCLAVYSNEAADIRDACSELFADDSRRFEMARAAMVYLRSAGPDPQSAAGTVIDELQRRHLL